MDAGFSKEAARCRIEAPLDVQIQHPGGAPTPLPGDAKGLYCRLARSIAIRVRVKMGLENRL
jgi:hypothetical protein